MPFIQSPSLATASSCAWISAPPLRLPNVSLKSTKSGSTLRRPRLVRRSRVHVQGCSPLKSDSEDGSEINNTQTPEEDSRTIRTTPFYVALVAAQMIPFVTSSGVLPDLVYFTITALSCIVIGVRRAPLEPPVLTAALSPKQAFAAPFTASVFLFGSYLLLKYTSIDINLILNGITTIAGTLCVKETLDPVFHTLLTMLSLKDATLVKGAPSPDGDEKKERLPVYVSDVMSAVTALGTTCAYLAKLEPSFVFSNVIAVSLATRVLSIIRPSSFLVGAGLLTGLFFYDIFWVFGSEVMVSVATQIDTPGKLLFPRDLSQAAPGSIQYPYAILGLGDVCIPGLFISLAQSMDQRFAPDVPKQAQPYFAAAVSAYTMGLGICFLVNYLTSAAQPALLYLVPALIGSSVAVAAWRGELSDVIRFSTESDLREPIPPETTDAVTESDSVAPPK